MFTQCPECGTVFRVTAAVLRAAQGQVRCGVCDANFDALRFLTDAVDGEVPTSPTADLPHAPAPPAPPAAPAVPRAAPPPPPPPPPLPLPPLRPPAPPPAAPTRAMAATRTTPSADEDRALAEIAAVLARDAHAAEVRANRASATRAPAPPHQPQPVVAAPAPSAEIDEANVLEPSDVENIVLGGDGPEGAEISDAALEFNVPPGQWDRVFVAEDGTDTMTRLDINLGELELAPADVAGEVNAAEQLLSLVDSPPAVSPPHRADARTAPSSGELTLAEDSLSRTDEYALLEIELADRQLPAPEPAAPAKAADPEPVEVDLESQATDPGGINVEDTWFDPVQAPAATAARAPAEAPDAPPPENFDFPIDETGFVPELEPARPGLRAGLAAGVAALALALLVQIVHHNREALDASEFAGGTLRSVYARLGLPIEPHWDLGAYDVKQWGAATDNAPGALKLRASLVNKATRAQPYPLLRVTLEDRFGAKVARREFTPAEYLPGRTAPTQLLAPGARADADLSLADPGSEAVGFELDVCLPRAGVLTCGSEPRTPGGG